MKLVGLDFETANYCKGSICAAGLALVENGILMDQREWLIRPHSSMDWMLKRFTEIHGIHYFQLRNCQEFIEVWPLMKMFIAQGELLGIHNAPFDLGHLAAVLKLYGLPGCTLEYLCSLQLSRRKFSAMPSYALNRMADLFHWDFQHHDALEDASICAMLAEKIGFEDFDRKQFVFTEMPQ